MVREGRRNEDFLSDNSIWGRLVDIIMNLELPEIFNLENMFNQFMVKDFVKIEKLDFYE